MVFGLKLHQCACTGNFLKDKGVKVLFDRADLATLGFAVGGVQLQCLLNMSSGLLFVIFKLEQNFGKVELGFQ
ncbi:MAG: hypothetical protein ACI8PD_000875 [Nitrospinales bacterium]